MYVVQKAILVHINNLELCQVRVEGKKKKCVTHTGIYLCY